MFALAPDPVGQGFVASLSRPGGNMTGLTSLSPELGAKRLEILRDTLPKFSRLAVLSAPGFPGVAVELPEVERAAKSLGMEVLLVEAKRPEDFEAQFAQAVRWRADALLVVEAPLFFTHRNTVAGLAEKSRLPAIYRAKEYAEAGGLMSYGADYADLCRRAAVYVDKTLKGAKPGDFPVEQPVKSELAIDLKAAKAMGLSIPQALLLRGPGARVMRTPPAP